MTLPRMLDILRRMEAGEISRLLADRTAWRTLLVDYHPPIVERLYRDAVFEGEPVRVFLHRIHPCEREQALFHPHPWPSAMRVLSGSYEMALGYGAGMDEPPMAARVVLTAGSSYEMNDPQSWHAVRPLGEPSLSLMVTGAPWERESHKPGKKLSALAPDVADEIFEAFLGAYPPA